MAAPASLLGAPIPLPNRAPRVLSFPARPWYAISRTHLLSQGAYRFFKRTVDLTVVTAVLPFAIPIILFCMAAVRLDSAGPALMRQPRTGKDGRRFGMFKLRTMVRNADELKAQLLHLNEHTYPDFKITNDPRITRCGRILRKLSLDELPQIFNVLRGDMTLVGPRPTSFGAETYRLWHTARLEVKPGLTGLWQVCGRSDLDFDDRLRLDVAYIRHRSLWLDVQILVRTAQAVIVLAGRTDMSIAAAAFWTAVLMLAYAYAGFPALVAVVGLWRRRRVRKAPFTPSVSFIVVAYNEAAVIADRIRNIFSLDYPREQLEVIVASDGSTDGTDAIVAAYAAEGVRLLSLPRRGKIPALNDAAGRATGDILVFSDANIHCAPGALRSLTGNFSDPSVGGVAGHCSYVVGARSESTSHGEQLYWGYDTWLKALESDTGSVVSAHGGLYAVRRSLFQPVTDASVTDDFAISTAVVEQGYRLVFEPDARAFEETTSEAKRELRRRVRLMTRGLRAVWLRRALLNPRRYGFYAIALLSHKILRRLAPVWLVVLLLSSAALAAQGHPWYIAAAAAQGVFYGLASAGWLLRRRRIGALTPLCVPFYYCMANAASAAALLYFLRGKRIALWQPQRST